MNIFLEGKIEYKNSINHIFLCLPLTMELIQSYYYQKIGSFYFESNRCLIADSGLTFEVLDTDLRNTLQDPMETLSDAEKNMGIYIQNIDNSLPWHVFIKIDSQTNNPLTVIAVAEEFLEDDTPEDTEAWSWDEHGFFMATAWLGIFDFTHFDDDDYIFNAFPEFYTDKNQHTLWHSYIIDKSNKADHQAHCEIIPFGVIIGGDIFAVDDQFFQVDSITQYGTLKTVALRIHLSEKSYIENTPTSTTPAITIPKPDFVTNIWETPADIMNKWALQYSPPITVPTFTWGQSKSNGQQNPCLDLRNLCKNDYKNDFQTQLENSLIESRPKVNSSKIKEI